MSTRGTFVQRQPLLTYFALAFAITWGGVLIVVGPGGLLATQEQFETMLPFVGLAVLTGPSVAGILLTGLVDGRSGLRDLLTRMKRWRVGGRWSVALILRHPLYVGVALLVLPWLGFLLGTWPSVVIGAVMYIASRRFAPLEEGALCEAFGAAWDEYARTIRIPWL